MNVTGHEQNDLLFCRMAILNLDPDEIKRDDSTTFDELEQRCAKCNFRHACAMDLKRDAKTPAWEAYCPNSALLNMLVDESCPYWRRYMGAES